MLSNTRTEKRFKISKKISTGVLLLLILAVAAGCSSQKAAETAQIGKTSASSQTSQSQDTAGKTQANPAVKAAMDILMIQRNTELALTSSQCASMKPILEELIAASDPTDAFLQTKADAITKLFTEDQKTFLSQRPLRKPQGNGAPPTDANGNTQAPPAGGNPPNGTPPGAGTPPDGSQVSSSTDAANANTQDTAKKPAAMDPLEIYKQALAALK